MGVATDFRTGTATDPENFRHPAELSTLNFHVDCCGFRWVAAPSGTHTTVAPSVRGHGGAVVKDEAIRAGTPVGGAVTWALGGAVRIQPLAGTETNQRD